VDKQLLSLIPSPERKSFIDNLAVLAAEMDRIEEKEPAKPARKLKTAEDARVTAEAHRQLMRGLLAHTLEIQIVVRRAHVIDCPVLADDRGIDAVSLSQPQVQPVAGRDV
jgi:hypothetical protein